MFSGRSPLTRITARFVGGCDTCRGLLTIDTSASQGQPVKPEVDYYVLGQASKFRPARRCPHRIRRARRNQLKDVAFRNPDGEIVLYALNAGTKSQDLRIGFHQKSAVTPIPARSVATFTWKP